MMSLERRLLLGIALSVLAAFAVLLGGGSFAVRELTEAYVYARLSRDAEALLAALHAGPAGALELREQRLSPIYSQPFSGQYFILLGVEADPIRSRSLWDETLPVARLAPGLERQGRLAFSDRQELLLHVAGFRKLGQDVTVGVAEDIGAMAQQIRRYQAISAAVFLVIFLLLLFAQRRVVRAALRRLDQLRADVQDVGAGIRRTLREAVPTEVRPLVQEFNRLLALLEQRLQRSRNAVGNLAHALKTPLSLLTAELERTGPPDRDRALDQTVRIRQLVDRELRRARIAGGGAPGQQFDPAADVPYLLESLRRLHRDRTLDLQAHTLPSALLPLDREDMLELLGNLLDNACKWAKAQVRLDIAQRSDRVEVTVDDDGPGVLKEDRSRLTARGTRIDETTRGHGLGLAIVSDIVKVYGGRLDFSTAPGLAGLRVRVTLGWSAPPPLAEPQAHGARQGGG